MRSIRTGRARSSGKQAFGKGSGLGGQWGGATDGEQFYVGLADFLTDTPGGMHALRLADGKPVWSVPPQPLLCGEKRPGCGPGQGAAPTVIPGAVLSVSLDGGLRAYRHEGRPYRLDVRCEP